MNSSPRDAERGRQRTWDWKPGSLPGAHHCLPMAFGCAPPTLSPQPNTEGPKGGTWRVREHQSKNGLYFFGCLENKKRRFLTSDTQVATGYFILEAPRSEHRFHGRGTSRRLEQHQSSARLACFSAACLPAVPFASAEDARSAPEETNARAPGGSWSVGDGSVERCCHARCPYTYLWLLMGQQASPSTATQQPFGRDWSSACLSPTGEPVGSCPYLQRCSRNTDEALDKQPLDCLCCVSTSCNTLVFPSALSRYWFGIHVTNGGKRFMLLHLKLVNNHIV